MYTLFLHLDLLNSFTNFLSSLNHYFGFIDTDFILFSFHHDIPVFIINIILEDLLIINKCWERWEIIGLHSFSKCAIAKMQSTQERPI
jgi:hypothetical protein